MKGKAPLKKKRMRRVKPVKEPEVPRVLKPSVRAYLMKRYT